MKRRISVSSAKAKGRALQRWVCQQLSELLGIPWGKDELIASREGGQSGTDIRLLGEARERFPFSIECKWQEAWSIPQWVKQAQANRQEGTSWLLIVKKNRMRPLAILDAELFFKIACNSNLAAARTGQQLADDEAEQELSD